MTNRPAFQKIVDFLEVLPENRFDIRHYADNRTMVYRTYHCDSVCCVVGYMPQLFPDEITLHHVTTDSPMNRVCKFLQITQKDYLYLFMAESYREHILDWIPKQEVIERLKNFASLNEVSLKNQEIVIDDMIRQLV